MKLYNDESVEEELRTCKDSKEFRSEVGSDEDRASLGGGGNGGAGGDTATLASEDLDETSVFRNKLLAADTSGWINMESLTEY